jgi:tRNA A-37 threonylcarbamoyl transferase component Bud32
MNNNNYGFIFNDIIISDNKFIKKSKNSLGRTKINNEIKFYKYIISNSIELSIPNLIEYKDGIIILEFIKNSSTLTNVINETNIFDYHKIIKNNLEKLHKNKISVLQEKLYSDLKIEIIDKNLTRFNEYDWYKNNDFKKIKSVNNIIIKDIKYYSNTIFTKLLNYLHDRNYYNLIHGDTHLGNILVDENKLYFIDPRGYFGNTELYGLCEYDYAKFLFGLSGYSFFDNLQINELVIKDNNIEIEFIKKYEFIFETELFDNIIKLLCLSIWLGNNSCFIDINKKITSLMIAYYYCEKYIDKF